MQQAKEKVSTSIDNKLCIERNGLDVEELAESNSPVNSFWPSRRRRVLKQVEEYELKLKRNLQRRIEELIN